MGSFPSRDLQLREGHFPVLNWGLSIFSTLVLGLPALTFSSIDWVLWDDPPNVGFSSGSPYSELLSKLLVVVRVLSGWFGPSFLFQLFFNMVFDFQKSSEGSVDTSIIPVFWVVCSGSRR